MHPPLYRPHPLCEKAVELLVACHKDNPFKKYLGACNQVKADLDQCFRAEKGVVRDKKYIEQIQDPRLMAIKNKQDQDDAAFAAWYENNKDK